jgi:hypothetical protein
MLPVDFPYPVDSFNHPLYPLAQINFEELPPFPGLPATGWLQFYISGTTDYGLLSKLIPGGIPRESKIITFFFKWTVMTRSCGEMRALAICLFTRMISLRRIFRKYYTIVVDWLQACDGGQIAVGGNFEGVK